MGKILEKLVVVNGTKSGTLYLTNGSGDLVTIAEAKDDPNLWQKRLRHMSNKGLKVLASKELVLTMRSDKIGFCGDCVLDKYKRVSFVKVTLERKEGKLELVHTNVWGPASIQSHDDS